MKAIDLSGTWELRLEPAGAPIPVTVPGDNFSALIDAGIMKDPFSGINELDARKFGLLDYSFKRTFAIPKDFLGGRGVVLLIESLDTFADVRINDTLCVSSSNMFTRIRKDVKEFLLPGDNTIAVSFRSSEREAELRAGLLPYPVPHMVYPVQSPKRNLARKVQCHAGWDWGPCLMVCGIYGGIRLEAADEGFIEYLYADVRKEGDRWAADATVEFTAYGSFKADLTLTLDGGAAAKRQVSVSPGPNVFKTTIYADNPELWWPAGLGFRRLYTLAAEMAGVTKTVKIGFRTLTCVAKDDEYGRSMTFNINGRDMFCKGANWIPMDALPARQTMDRYEALLEAAVEANMNMLRIWGGGQYEKDEFYDLCDEKGILLWQDFMFSCSLYPSADWFLSEVDGEIRHQVKRLKSHPCLAIWCGNNEDIGALTWFEESKKNRDRYLVDYDRLNEGVVGRITRELDPVRTFWPSSPSGGPGDYSDCWHDDGRGDMHYWSVWHEGKPFEAYREVVPRFCSEFGFQSFPSMETVGTFAPEDQWNLTSPVMEHHQRNPRGNTIILSTMSRYFRLPKDFENYLYLSQVQQALAMTMAVEYWRSMRPRCMGALYWQLDDTWPAASWSSIEYSGKWKLLHYAAKRFFAPVHIMCCSTTDGYWEVWVVNDTQEPVLATADLRIFDFDGGEKRSGDFKAEVPPDSSMHIRTFSLPDFGFAPDECFLVMGLYGKDLDVENACFFDLPKRCEPREPRISLAADPESFTEGKGSGRDGVLITVKSEKPAFYVSLDAEGIPGRFTDNMFFLLPGQEKKVLFLPGKSGGRPLPSRDEFLSKLKLKHLRDSYE